MEQNTCKGSGFLKVVGILMIVFGSIALIVSIIYILGISAIAYVSDGELTSGMLYASGALMLFDSIAEFVVGIIGVVNCKKPEKATTCMVWGIIVAVFCVAGVIFNAIGGQDFNIFYLFSGLILPVLYIIGASLNKKSQ